MKEGFWTFINGSKEELPIVPNDLCYWDEYYGELKGSQKQKALHFNRKGCYVWCPTEKVFLCKPIKGYNTTTHKMYKKEGEWICTCQWNRRNLLKCSHLIGLFLWFKNKRFENE